MFKDITMDSTIEIYDIYDIVYSPYWWENSIPWICIGFFCIVMLLFFVYRVIKNRLQKKETLLEKTLKSIALLDKQKNAISHQVFYGSLTSLLKDFFCHQYGKQLQGKTDNEFIDVLAHEKTPHDIMGDITGIFKGVEVIKFANQQALVSKRDEDLIRAKSMIEKIALKNV